MPCCAAACLCCLQSYNTGVNYANRSGATVELQSILESYALAVVTSCSLAAGGSKVGHTPPSPI